LLPPSPTRLPGLALLLTLITIVYDKRQGGLLNASAKVVAGAFAALLISLSRPNWRFLCRF
jgi:hypothetical protein